MKNVLLVDGPRAGEIERVADNAVGVAAGGSARGPWYRRSARAAMKIDEVWSLDPSSVDPDPATE